MPDPAPIANSQLPDWFTPRRFAVFLLLAFVLAFPGIWMGTETFFRSDYGVMAYPAAHYLRESIRAGELPLWNPLSNCGAPFLAQWGTMCLYPGSLFFVALPMPWALGVFCLLHLWLGGLGARALAERWTSNRFAAAVAGTAFAINGASLACITWPNYCVALGWMPWIVLLTEQAWREGGRKLVLAALAGTMQMLTGVPELVLMTWGLLGVLLVAEWVQSAKCKVQSSLALDCSEPQRAPTTSTSLAPIGGAGRGEGTGHEQTIATESPNPSPLLTSHFSLLTRFLFVILLIATLSAAQLLPFFDLLAHSQRDASYHDARWPMPPWGWANFLVPLFRYFQTPQGFWVQQDQYFLSSYYLGLGTLALALVAVWKARERRVWLLAGVTLFALVMALGDAGFLYTALKSVLPGSLIARFPVKFVLLAAFTVPMLAAYGVAWLQRRASFQLAIGAKVPVENNRSRRVGGELEARPTLAPLLHLSLALVAGVALIIWLGQQHPLPYDRWPETKGNALVRLVCVGLLLLALALMDRAQWLSDRARKWTLLGVLAVLAFDAFVHLPNQLPRLAADHFNPLAVITQGHRRWPAQGEGRIFLSPEREQTLLQSAVSDWGMDTLQKRLFFWSHINLVDGVPKVNGSSNLRLRDQDELQRRLYPTNHVSSPHHMALLDFLAVTYFAKGTGIPTFPDPRPLPPRLGETPLTLMEKPDRAWEGRTNSQALVATGALPAFREQPSVLDALTTTDFDPRRVVYLPPEAQGSVPTNSANASVTTRRFAAHEILAEVETDAPTLVTVAQSFYHPWRAFADGQPVKLWRANYAFQALAVPAGKHTVRLVYVDEKFRLGVGISLAGLAVCSFLWWKSSRPKAQSPKPL